MKKKKTTGCYVKVEPTWILPFHLWRANRPKLTDDEANAQYEAFFVDEQRRSCNDIIQQIKRHVDDTGGVELCYDIEDVCSFCGAQWTEGDGTHNGGCCDEDEAVMIAEEGGE